MKLKELISKVDKKVLIGIAAAVVCLIVVIIILVSCGSDKDSEENSTEPKKTTEAESTKKSETTKDKDDKDADDDTDADETSSDETDTEETETSDAETTENNETTSESDTISQNNAGTTTGNSNGNTTVGNTGSTSGSTAGSTSGNSGGNTSSNNQTTTKPSEQPTSSQVQAGGESGTTHEEFPAEDLSVTTVEIAAGSSVYYDIYRTGGKVLEINSSDAYVVYDGKKYTPQNGVVRIQVEQALASDAVRFEIGNSSSSKQSFKLQFSDPKGTYDNPEKLTSLGGTYSTYSAAGNQLGYNYLYTAEKTGTIVFYVDSVSSSNKNASAGISVQNNNSYANRTTAADGVDDGQGHIMIEMNVTQGDVIRIVVAVEPTATWKYPEATITWVAQYK